jgi:hypothetical protein
VTAPAELPRLDRAEKYAEVVHRIYHDRRAAPPARELLLAVAYAVFVSPTEPGRRLTAAAHVLGRKAGQPRFDTLVAADAPRYEPPREAGDWSPGQAPGCQAPRLREIPPVTTTSISTYGKPTCPASNSIRVAPMGSPRTYLKETWLKRTCVMRP